MHMQIICLKRIINNKNVLNQQKCFLRLKSSRSTFLQQGNSIHIFITCIHNKKLISHCKGTVIWLKYSRYGVKLQWINQSTNQLHKEINKSYMIRSWWLDDDRDIPLLLLTMSSRSFLAFRTFCSASTVSFIQNENVIKVIVPTIFAFFKELL